MNISNQHHGHISQPGVAAGWLQSAISSIVEGYRAVKQRREDRAAFANLLHLDDAILQDIGVSKADVVWASKLPLHVNASFELSKISRRGGPPSQ